MWKVNSYLYLWLSLVTLHTTALYFQLKCPKLKSHENAFEIDLISGTYTSGWKLCGLRLFQGGRLNL